MYIVNIEIFAYHNDDDGEIGWHYNQGHLNSVINNGEIARERKNWDKIENIKKTMTHSTGDMTWHDIQ